MVIVSGVYVDSGQVGMSEHGGKLRECILSLAKEFTASRFAGGANIGTALEGEEEQRGAIGAAGLHPVGKTALI